MAQSAVADVNSAVVLYRNHLNRAYLAKNWDDCLMFLDTMNSMLPEKFRIKHSPDWDRQKITVKCPNPKCKLAIVYDEKAMIEDTRLRGINGKNQGPRYLECKCKKRVYVDGQQVKVKLYEVDRYALDTKHPPPPPTNPPVEPERYKIYIQSMLPILEDRCRQWRESYSTTDAGISAAEENDDAD